MLSRGLRALSTFGEVDDKIVSLLSDIVGPSNVTTSESG